MALQQYSSSAVYINNAQLTENANVTVDRESGMQPVMTVAKGFAGVSPGSRLMKVTISGAVPSAGFEWNPGETMAGLVVVSLTVFAAGQSLITRGFVEKDNFAHAVNQEAKLDISLICEFADWQ